MTPFERIQVQALSQSSGILSFVSPPRGVVGAGPMSPSPPEGDRSLAGHVAGGR